MAKSTRTSLLTVNLSGETDCVLARQRAKQIAEIIGFEVQDQTRIATSVSEIARNAWEYGGGGRVEFAWEAGTPSSLIIVVTDTGIGIADLDSILGGSYTSRSGMGIGIAGSRRLLDDMQIETSSKGTTVTMRKNLPWKIEPPSPSAIAQQLSKLPPQNVGSLLRTQNHEMLRLLNELRERETELTQLNQELKETNRGVMVLYSELEDRAQELQHASEMKSRFVSGISHELRTPLNSIVSLAGLLLRRLDGDLLPEQEKQVLFIQRSALNLTDMVNDLLDLAKIEAGKATLRPSSFTVGDVFAALRGMFRPLATNEHVQLIFTENNLSSTILYTDEGKLGQILRNFVSNALKFTEKGSVEVSAALFGEDGVRFSVRDTGVGIAPANHDIVWQEWGQIEEDQRPRHKGSGLGLPLSRQLALLLGGSTGLRSEEHKGSTFYVELPGIVTQLDSGAHSGGSASDTMLIVDDDEVARYILRRNLFGLTSATPLEASSVSEARELLRTHRPAIIFLDIVMPETTGLEFASELRSNPEYKDLPIVIISSKVLASDEKELLETLHLPFIQKQAGDAEDQRVALERALLNTGFNNLHQAGYAE